MIAQSKREIFKEPFHFRIVLRSTIDVFICAYFISPRFPYHQKDFFLS